MNFQLPVININIESCEGGLRYGSDAERARFDENLIVLVHEGGSPLALKTTSLKIQGYGNSYQGIVGDGGKVLKGDTSVFYTDLSSEKKNPDEYLARNRATLKDGYWTAGEKLVLCGRDSAIGTEDSSVKVNVNGVGNTTDNYGFKAGSEITLVIIDTEGRNVLAKRTAVVEFAGE
ncbi:type IV pilin [Methanosarcina sp. KYL-1]|uniref:type IV pilin n=1 Tax=Methanosarcina sp. KYL-1 TaxID=2602068 RepID=UPI00210148A4|nr:type IV pilin [Methanosarcina sp. KYL-1]